MSPEDIPLRYRAAAGAVVLLVLGASLLVLLRAHTGHPGSRLTAEFGRAGQGLGGTSPVKIRGVVVGNVAAVSLTGAGRARVVLRIDPSVRVPDTAVASIEPESILGPKYVDLAPGGHEATGPYLADGARIARTADPADLSDLIGDFEPLTRAIDPAKLAVIMHTLGAGLRGQGPALHELNDDLAHLAQVAADDPNSLAQLITNGNRITRRVTGRDASRITTGLNTIISPLAAGDGRLARLADQTAAAAYVLNQGLGRHRGDLAQGFRSAERATALIYAQLGLAGDAVRKGNRLLPLWRQLTTTRGPDGKHLLSGKFYIYDNPCMIILGLCTGGR